MITHIRLISALLLLASCYVRATPPPYATSTTNQALVAAQLETLTDPTLQETIVLNFIVPMTTKETQKALNQLSGEQYTSLFISTELTNRQFFRRLYDPLRPIISNPCVSKEEVYDLCSADGIDAWVECSGNRSFLDGNKNAQGFKMSGYEISFGAQKRLDSYWTLGGAGCYAMNHFNYNVGGSGKTNTVYGAAYALYRPTRYYVLLNAAYGYGKNDMHRTIILKEEKNLKKEERKDEKFIFKSKPNISQASFYGEIGIDWNWNCFLFQPFAGFEAYHFKRQCERESSLIPFNLVISGKKLLNTHTRLGFHLTTPEDCRDLTFAFDFAWQYRLTEMNNDLSARFAHFGTPFKITGVPTERNSLYGAVAVWSEFLEGWTVYLEASGERWKRLSSYNFTGGFIFKW